MSIFGKLVARLISEILRFAQDDKVA